MTKEKRAKAAAAKKCDNYTGEMNRDCSKAIVKVKLLRSGLGIQISLHYQNGGESGYQPP